MPPLAPSFHGLDAVSSAVTIFSSIRDWFASVGHNIAAAAAWISNLPARTFNTIMAGIEAAAEWAAHALKLLLLYLLAAAAVLAAAICFGAILYVIAMRTLSYQNPQRPDSWLSAERRRLQGNAAGRDPREHFGQTSYSYWDRRDHDRHGGPGDRHGRHANAQQYGTGLSGRPQGRQHGDDNGSAQRQYREEERNPEDESQRRRAEEERQHRQRKEQEARHEAAAKTFEWQEAARQYAEWKAKCNNFFKSDTGDIPEPPHWPCEEPSCQRRRLLKACQHSLEKLFASGGRLDEILKEELRRWHPDRAIFRRRGERHVAIAEEIAKTIGSLRSS